MAFPNATQDNTADSKYYLDAGNGYDLDDHDVLGFHGSTLKTRSDYVVFAGNEPSGTLAFAIPKNILKATPGTHFVGYFQSKETDTGAGPIPLNVSFGDCQIK